MNFSFLKILGLAGALALFGCNDSDKKDVDINGGGGPTQVTAPGLGTSSLPRVVNKLPKKTKCAPLDLMIMFDSTGSMSDDIEQARRKGREILNTIGRMYKGTRYAVATVADFDDDPYVLMSDFDIDVNKAVNAIGRIGVNGGGDSPEAYSYGLRMASNESWRADAYRLVVLIADSKAHSESKLSESVNNANFDLVTLMGEESLIPYWQKQGKAVLPLVSNLNLEGMLLRAVMIGCGDYPGVKFDTAKYSLDRKDKLELDKLVKEIKSKSRNGQNLAVRVEGHTDKVGEDVANYLLGMKRARSVSNYLRSKGIVVLASAYGEDKPLCREETNSCLALNRRAHLYPVLLPTKLMKDVPQILGRGDRFELSDAGNGFVVYSFIPTSSRHFAGNIAKDFNYLVAKAKSSFRGVGSGDIYSDARLSNNAAQVRKSKPVYVRVRLK